MRAKLDVATKSVAVIGIGCRFPGGVVDPASFWRLLCEGRDAITEIPANRIDIHHYFDPRPATPGRMMTRWGGFLERLDEFDAAFFGISPREAERLDPQQRLLLETAWEALEDAGQDANALHGSATGVFVGQWLSDFESRLFADPEAVDFYMTTGSGRYAASGRLSYVLGLRGPSLTIDTACSSSLVAIHTAVRSIRSGDCTLAIAGGANVILQPHVSIAYSQSRMMAPDGRCKFGDASGDGYVRSEGVGLVVLKPLDKALADGDRIYAVVRGSAVNNDGRSSGSMGTPSRTGQEELLRAAYDDAAISPGDVGYIEAHGTGTRAGDPVELGALGAVLAEGRAPGRRALVGSVKTNFGHTEGAAGVAGFIKAALCLHHQAIPPSLHCKEPNPAVPWAEAPVEIPTGMREWQGEGERRVAGVSAFGIAGTNAHVVLEQAPPHLVAAPKPRRDEHLLVLSARSPEALRTLSLRYAELIAKPNGPDLAAVCASAALRRTALEHRAAFIGADSAAMREALERYAAGEPALAEGVAHGLPRVVFVVPGQGAQWIGMARRLVAAEPVFLESLRRCDEAAGPFVEWSILEQLHLEPGAPGFRLDQIDVIQPVLVALAIAYADWLGAHGVRPDAVIGHSMGEVGAAYLAGVLDLEQAMRIICRRSALMSRTSGQGAMAVVDLPMADAAARLAGREDRVAVAVSNSPRSCVISGDPEVIREVLVECERDGVFCRQVNVDVASHSPQMEGPAAALAEELQDLVPKEARIPIVSTVYGRRAEGAELDAGYWARNLRQPVRFGDGVASLLEEGASVFVELGPHPVLLQALQQNAQVRGDGEVVTVACGRREEVDEIRALTVLASLWCAGYPVEWKPLVSVVAPPVQLPSYPWQRERHWVREAEPLRPGHGGARPKPIAAEMHDWLHRLEWRAAEPPTISDAGFQPDRPWIIVSDDRELAAAVSSTLEARGAHVRISSYADMTEAVEAASDAAPAGIVLLLPSGMRAAFQPIVALQASARVFAGRDESRCPKHWIVTRGAQAVGGQPRPVDVEQGSVWGAGRVLAEEHPDLWGGLVDLDPQDAAEGGARQLVDAFLTLDGEDQVAFRGDRRFVLRLLPYEGAASLEARFPWRPDGAYLITGGLGGLGLRIAAAMVQQGARRLVLMGRSTLPARTEWAATDPKSPIGQRIAAVQALESAGAAVHVLSADVTDAFDLERALRQYAAEAWPPIVGVVHAAGVVENRLALKLDAATFDRVVGPKLAGARNLDRLLPDVELFILFSSISAVLGLTGMANYAAANAAVDAVAASRSSRGAHGLSIQWGAWRDTGMHAGEAARRNDEDLLRQGIRTIPPEAGVELFGALATSVGSSCTVLPIEWSAFRSARGGRVRALFRERIAAGAATADGAAEFALRLAAARTPDHRRRLLETAIRETAAKVLRTSPQRLDPRRPLGTMGLDSLMAVELRNRLEALLGRSLSATLTWNYPTVEALAAYLGGESPGSPSPAEAAESESPSEAVPESLADVVELSDEDIVRKLRSARRKST